MANENKNTTEVKKEKFTWKNAGKAFLGGVKKYAIPCAITAVIEAGAILLWGAHTSTETKEFVKKVEEANGEFVQF